MLSRYHASAKRGSRSTARWERLGGHCGDAIDPLGRPDAQAREQAESELVHEIERLGDPPLAGGLSHCFATPGRTLVDFVEKGVDLKAATDLDHASEHEPARAQVPCRS